VLIFAAPEHLKQSQDAFHFRVLGGSRTGPASLVKHDGELQNMGLKNNDLL
jgi:hypothetical protein